MRQKSILIVDDMEINRVVLAQLFIGDYDILQADNGYDAIKLLEEYRHSIVVVLLDILMPDVDGFDVLLSMQSKTIRQTIPVILITAEATEENTLKAYSLGASDFITKPFSPNIVKKRVHNIIELYDHKNDLEDMVAEQTKALQLQAKKLKENNAFMSDILSAVVEFRDCESGQHVKRIRNTTKLMLEALMETKEYSFTQDQIEVIAQTSALHDIGKIAIPDAILLKPGKLTTEEFEIMKQHTIRGAEILQEVEGYDAEFFRYAYDICRSHHEKWDGKGYPDHLSGNEIPIWAQIVSIADIYDALTHERVYKSAYSHEKTIEMIKNGECGAFNPLILDCLEKISPELTTFIEEV